MGHDKFIQIIAAVVLTFAVAGAVALSPSINEGAS